VALGLLREVLLGGHVQHDGAQLSAMQQIFILRRQSSALASVAAVDDCADGLAAGEERLDGEHGVFGMAQHHHLAGDEAELALEGLAFCELLRSWQERRRCVEVLHQLQRCHYEQQS